MNTSFFIKNQNLNWNTFSLSKRILEAYNNGVEIDEDTLKLMKLFNLEPLTDEENEENEYY